MKPKLCKAGQRLRSQINHAYPDRDTTSDGWIGNQAHQLSPSDHNPASPSGFVRAIDVDRDLSGKPKPDVMPYLADQIRLCAKAGDKRIKYVIFDRKICSKKTLWRWVKYRGISPHTHHCHVSFTEAGDLQGQKFAIPLLEK